MDNPLKKMNRLLKNKKKFNQKNIQNLQIQQNQQNQQNNIINILSNNIRPYNYHLPLIYNDLIYQNNLLNQKNNNKNLKKNNNQQIKNNIEEQHENEDKNEFIHINNNDNENVKNDDDIVSLTNLSGSSIELAKNNEKIEYYFYSSKNMNNFSKEQNTNNDNNNILKEEIKNNNVDKLEKELKEYEEKEVLEKKKKKEEMDMVKKKNKLKILERLNQNYIFNFEELNNIIKNITYNKYGLEIGGPSIRTGNIIYENSKKIDNTILSQSIKIEKYTNKKKYNYIYLNDHTNLKDIENNKYDFIFSSNCLEHIANPLKAIEESLRVLKKNGCIILILPEKRYTFDHFRKYSEFKDLFDAYLSNKKEDDLSNLENILKYHDLSKDRIHTKFDDFKEKCEKNFETRIIHHYVYHFDLLMQICNYFKCDFIYKFENHVDLWFIMRKN